MATNKKGQVKLYTLSTCIHCRKLKEFLKRINVDYDFVDVDLLQGEERKAMVEEVKKFNPGCTFPTTVIGDEVIVGFDEIKIKKALKNTPAA